MLTANIPSRFLDMVEDFFQLFRINRLQDNLSYIKFFFDFCQRNIPEVIFNQRNQLRQVTIQPGSVEPNFRNQKLRCLPTVLAVRFNNG